IQSIEESILDDSQITIRNALMSDRHAFEAKRIEEYLVFAKELRML
ncbi:MAG: transcriptional regulator, partial [Flavobacteriaceae bacterium]|nr:transcriptional regulator [Flavobacteriaceae bacterium]